MSHSFEYLPEIAIADAAFVARGSSLAELFTAAALATTGIMVELEDIRQTAERQISLDADSREDLLYQWLSELLYIKDVEYLVFSGFDLAVAEDSGRCRLSGKAFGERIDQQRHRLGQDVKAVTYHLFEIKQDSGEFTARVVLDI